jgi:endo-beta-N-acetylglucosaminidase D
MFKELTQKTQKAVDALGVDVKVTVERNDENGRYYLTGKFVQRLKFKGFDDMFVQETKLTEEIFPDADTAFRLFMGFFTPNRVAHMKATDEEVMAYEGHPAHYPIA